MKKLGLVAVTIAMAASAFGQTSENPWSIGLMGVKNEYYGDLGRYKKPDAVPGESTGNFYNYRDNTFLDFNHLFGGGAITVDRYLCKYFTVGVNLSCGTFGYRQNVEDHYWTDGYRKMDVDFLINGELNAKYKFIGTEWKVIPYLTVGVNSLNYINTIVTRNDAKQSSDYKGALGLTGGIGFDIPVYKNWGIRYEYDFTWTSRDNVDFWNRKANDLQGQHMLGVTYTFGKSAVAAVVAPVAKADNTAKASKKNVKGTIKDSESNEPVRAKVEIKNEDGTKSVYSSKGSDFDVKLEDGTYVVSASAPGYMPYSDVVKVNSDSALNLSMQKVANGKKVALRNLFFATGDSTMLKTSKQGQEVLYDFLKDNKDVKIKVVGYTDNTGSDQINNKLSQSRANTVANDMIKRGIDKSRITAIGRGSQNPVVSNDTEYGRSLNRRVEIEVEK